MSVYQLIRDYHALHGDDVSEPSRYARYNTILELIDLAKAPASMLDVGSGAGRLERYLNRYHYTGIDLLDGVNVLDWHEPADVVVANGIFYKLPHSEEAWRLIKHMWGLARHALIFTSLSTWAPHHNPDELYLNPANTLLRCYHLTQNIVLRHDYLPHDFAIGLYKCRGTTPQSHASTTGVATSRTPTSTQSYKNSETRLAA